MRQTIDGTRPLLDSGVLLPAHQSSAWLFLVLQRDRPLAPSARYRLGTLDQLTLGRGDARTRESRDPRGLHLTIDDPWMSRVHSRIVREGTRFVLEDAGSRNGTSRNGSRIEGRVTLEDRDLIEIGRSFFLYRDSLSGHMHDLEEADLERSAKIVHTMSPVFAAELERLALVAQTAISVLLIGETGVGKEVVARAVHMLSARPGPFLGVNCAALTESVLQGELFGHKRGAFSGAVEDRPGLVRSANHGTLLLDEIGDFPVASQGTLLRVLQEGEVLPVGANSPVSVDCRIISATHRELDSLVLEGSFRADLLARVSGFVFRIMPLRERREDLGMLLRHFLRTYAHDPSVVSLSAHATRALLGHAWPLNVRELEKCVAAAVVQAPDGRIRSAHLPEALRSLASAAAPPVRPSETSAGDVERRAQLVSLLRETHGNVSEVARTTGHARAQIHRWLKRYKIDLAAFRSP
jgi:transcriptional regulator with GAF, ATPase, and Fis domain